MPYTVSRVGRITTHPDHLLLLKQAKYHQSEFSIKGGSNLSETQARNFSAVLKQGIFLVLWFSFVRYLRESERITSKKTATPTGKENKIKEYV